MGKNLHEREVSSSRNKRFSLVKTETFPILKITKIIQILKYIFRVLPRTVRVINKRRVPQETRKIYFKIIHTNYFALYVLTLRQEDPEIFASIQAETTRQEYELELIASENYASKAVMEAAGSVLMNKYSEGYPGKRYYAGQTNIDVVENLAINRAKEIFGAEYVNVQPLSGSPANLAVYLGLLQPGDTVLGMSLDQGGHLSHGHPLNFSGLLYKIVSYGVDKTTETIDMDEVERIAIESKPRMIIAGFSAYSRDLDWKRFRDIADKVGAYLMADISHIAGLVAGKVLTNPVPYCDVVTTTTHKTLR